MNTMKDKHKKYLLWGGIAVLALYLANTAGVI